MVLTVNWSFLSRVKWVKRIWGDLELLVQGGVGDMQLAGSGNLVGELELLVQGRVGDRLLAGSGNLVG